VTAALEKGDDQKRDGWMKKRALQTVLIVSVRLLVAKGGIAHFGIATAQIPAPDKGCRCGLDEAR
jgi:hypothetical protein